MIVVGITGTLGAGKSTVGELFEEWGAYRIDADRLAREAVRPDSPALERIREEWGEEVLDAGGGLDREAMRRIAFRDPEARRRLEEIVHPEVARLRDERLREAEAAGAEVVAGEVPLLFEAGMEDDFDVIVVVDADPELRRRRVAEARGIDGETFRAIEEAQWPASRKRSAADHVVENDGSREELERRARAAWEAIRRRHA